MMIVEKGKGDGVLLKRTSPSHECRLPIGRIGLPWYAPGSIWQCDICEQHYLSKDPLLGLPHWCPISPRRAKKLLKR
jgi:hypothetical protein